MSAADGEGAALIALDPALANALGFAGMACIIFAYAYITGRARPNPFVQHGVNLAGAALLTLSLLVHMNPASLVLEMFWAAIAVWGLVKALRGRRRSRGPEHNTRDKRAGDL